MMSHPRPPSKASWLLPALAVVIAAAGCLPIDEDDGFEPMCVSTSDCDAGEACEEGICWGNPPATPFAAQLLPPGEDDQGLATTEIPALEIGPDGWVANLAFAPSATIRGRVTLACDQSPANPGCDPATTIAATIFASRKSAIPGQPLYTRTVTSRLGAIDDEISFSLSLPVSEEPYEIIITPVTPDENTSASELLPVQLAPPSRLTLQIDGADTMESEAWVVGQSANYMVLEGEVLDSLENPMPGMKVKAEMPGASARRVSSLAFTDDQGHFSLRILRDLGIDEVEIIAEPRDGMNVPTVRVRHVAISEAVPLEPLVIELPSFGDPVPYSLPIEGADGSGGTEPIAGATVRAITFFTEPDAPVVSTYSTSTVTDQDGQAQLMLIPGKRLENRTYNIIVEPPRESPHAARFDVTTTIGSADGGTLEAIDLDRRVAISGLVKEADGSDANGASIEIRLSRPFVDSLDPSLRALVDNIALPKVTTSANGRFVFYLDRRLAGIPTLYDIVIRSGDPLGAWRLIDGVDIDELEDGEIELGEVHIPDASYARGLIQSPNGALVPGAQLRLLEIDPGCLSAEPTTACAPPRDHGARTSRDEDGQVTLILPIPSELDETATESEPDSVDDD